jgi:hypothetical protein
MVLPSLSLLVHVTWPDGDSNHDQELELERYLPG